MGFLRRAAAASPSSSYQDLGGGVVIDLQNPEHVAYLRAGGGLASSGASVTEATAMRVATAWRCLHVLAGLCGNQPIDVYRRVDERTRVAAEGHPLRKLLTESPNGWQTPSEFIKMLTVHAVNQGDGYALIIYSLGRPIALWPLDNPAGMEVRQLDDATRSLVYIYTTKSGRRIELTQADVLHLRGLSIDGLKGMGVLRAAREALGLSMVQEQAASRVFKNGVLAGGALATAQKLSEEAYRRLQASLDDKSGTENAGKMMILEEGLDFSKGVFSAEDLQFLEGRKFSRTEICMFYGVPEFMVGIGDKDSNWGTGLEARFIAFLQSSGLDLIKMWEGALMRDCLSAADRAAGVFVKIDLRGLLRGDFKTRTEGYAKALGAGGADTSYMTKNEVRALEDLPPIAGGDELPKPAPVKPPKPPADEDDPDSDDEDADEAPKRRR